MSKPKYDTTVAPTVDELRGMVASLATHMACLACLLEPRHGDIKKSSIAFSEAAMAFLRSSIVAEPPTEPEGET